MKRGAETIDVVRPVPKRERRAGAPRREQGTRAGQKPPAGDSDFAQFLADIRAANRAEAEKTRALLLPPSPEELERRRTVAERIRAAWPDRVIAPLTTADLIHIARTEEEEAYGQPR